MDFKENFKGKRITIMGLGLLGRGVGDASFLAESGAELIITDLKSKEELAESLDKLEKYDNISYVLGEHRLADFRDRDFILKAAGVPLDSPYIQEARENNVPIKMSASLFAEYAKDINLVGVTGTRGKSTVTSLLCHILRTAGCSVLLGGNVQGVSTLSLLKDVKKGDIALFELDSWQLQGFGEAGISPHIAIFTNFMQDHLNYYKGDMDLYFKDKANIFINQKKSDTLIADSNVQALIKEKSYKPVSAVVSPSDVPADWNLLIPGRHNRINTAFAIEAARLFNIDEKIIRSSVESFKGVFGRLEFLNEINGIKIYNDTNSTTPEASCVALETLGDRDKKNIILVMGGSDKELDMKKLSKMIPLYCKKVVYLSGKGTEKFRMDYPEISILGEETFLDLKEAIDKAMSYAETGDILLFSPAFSSFGMFKNEFDRGSQFVQIVEAL